MVQEPKTNLKITIILLTMKESRILPVIQGVGGLEISFVVWNKKINFGNYLLRTEHEKKL